MTFETIDTIAFVHLGGGWDPTSFEDKAGQEEIYVRKADGAGCLVGTFDLAAADTDALNWMLEIEGVTQGAFTLSGNWVQPEAYLQDATCRGALVFASKDAAPAEALIVNLSLGLADTAGTAQIADGAAGIVHAIIPVEPDAGGKAICAFPDVCFTPPQDQPVDDPGEPVHWEAVHGIIGILVAFDGDGTALPEALVYAEVWERLIEQIADDLTIDGPSATGDILL